MTQWKFILVIFLKFGFWWAQESRFSAEKDGTKTEVSEMGILGSDTSKEGRQVQSQEWKWFPWPLGVIPEKWSLSKEIQVIHGAEQEWSSSLNSVGRISNEEDRSLARSNVVRS